LETRYFRWKPGAFKLLLLWVINLTNWIQLVQGPHHARHEQRAEADEGAGGDAEDQSGAGVLRRLFLRRAAHRLRYNDNKLWGGELFTSEKNQEKDAKKDY
jgi:hypothetical protein